MPQRTYRTSKMVVIGLRENAVQTASEPEPYPDFITCPNCEDVQMPRTPHSTIYRCPVCEYRETR